MDVNETWMYTGSYTATQADIDNNGGGSLAGFATALPNQVTISVQNPGTGFGAPSYFDVTITNGGTLNGTYDNWCIDTDHTISNGTLYTANVYSSYETIPNGLVENPQNLDLVNWIINQNYVGTTSYDLLGPDAGSNGFGESLGNYTYGDIQRAIWTLVEDTNSTSGLGTWSQNRVDEIVAAANANGEGFTPDCDDKIAVILAPVGGNNQVTIAQVTLAEVDVPCDDGCIVNVASVDTDQTTQKSDSECVEVVQNPAIDVEKYVSVDGGSNWLEADTITGPELLTGNNPQFKFVVTNTGNVTLSNVILNDSDFNLDGLTGDTTNGNSQYDIGTLGAGASKEVIFTGATWQAGQHTNTAATSGKFGTQTVSDSDDANYFGANPGIDVEKYVSVDGGTTWEDADTATGPALLTGNNPQFKFVVKNTGNVNLSNVTLDDSKFDLNGPAAGTEITIGNLAVGGTYETIFTGATWQAGQHTNTATTSGSYTDNGGHSTTKSDSDDANYFGANPGIDVEKYVSVDGGTTWEDADTATGPALLTGNNPQFKFVVKNTGNVNLSNVTLDDSKFDLNGPAAGTEITIGNLAVGGTYETIFTGATWQAGQHTNTATTSGSYTDNGGHSTTNSDSDAANYFGANPGIDVEKYVSVDGGTTWEDADTATGPSLLTGNNPQFKFVVKNTGNVNLSNVTLDDSKFDLNGPAAGTEITIGNLAVGGTYETIFTGATWQAGQHTNTATTSGSYTDNGGHSTTNSDSDDANYFGANPGIDVEKYVSVDGGTTWEDADTATGPSLLTGNNPQFKFVVKNTGNVNLSNVTLDDSKFDLNGAAAGTEITIGNLAVGGTYETIFTGATWQAGQHTNTATTSGSYTDNGGHSTTNSDSDAANYFGANPGINIDKVTDNGAVQGDGLLIQSGSAIKWIYTVTNTGNVGLSNITVTDNQGVTPVSVDLNNDTFNDGDIDKDKILDVTEAWTYEASGTSISGSYQNTGTAQGSFTDDGNHTQQVTDSDDSSYTGVISPGARTPGFWKNWAEVWNGTKADDSKFAGKDGFPLSDILLAPYSTFQDTDNDGKVDTAKDPVTGTLELGILVGDWNKNGVTDNSEKTLFYSLTEAMTIISADQKVQQDKRYTLDRSLIASWLNYLAVNPAPTGDMKQAIEWMQAHTPNENSVAGGDGNLVLGASTWAVAANSAAWANSSDVYGGLPTGEVLNAKLDYYNNTGLFGTQPI